MTTPNVPGNYYQPRRPHIARPPNRKLLNVAIIVVALGMSITFWGCVLLASFNSSSYSRLPQTLDISATTDGRYVVVGTASEESDLVTVHNLDTGTRVDCHVGMSHVANPILDPTRQAILFGSGGAIWTTPLLGGRPRIVTPNYHFAFSPALSRDGATLYYTRAVARHPLKGPGGWEDYDLFAIGLAGGLETQVTHSSGLQSLLSPSVTPDGRFMFVSTETNYESARIYRVDLQNGFMEAVTPRDQNCETPILYDTGQRLIFLQVHTTQNGKTDEDIYTMHSDGTDVHRLSSSLSAPSCPVVLESRKLILFVQHGAETDKPEIWQMPLGGGTATRATVLHQHPSPVQSFDLEGLVAL